MSQRFFEQVLFVTKKLREEIEGVRVLRSKEFGSFEASDREMAGISLSTLLKQFVSPSQSHRMKKCV